MYADTASNFTLALVLTLLFGLITFLLYRRSGRTSTLAIGAGFTLLPFGLWLTRTLALLSAIVDDIGSWATNLVLSPRVWVGVAIVVLGVLLILGGLGARRRGGDAEGTTSKREMKKERRATPEVGAVPARTTKPAQPAKSSGDDEMDEIEALLRKRGIS